MLVGFQCPRWKLFSHAEVRSSSPLPTPKLLGKVGSITLLCFCTCDILDKVLVIKKRRRKKKSGLRGFLDVQGYNTGYWCRLEVISVLPGVTWFSVPLQRTHIKPHTSSGGVMALLPTDETLKKTLCNNVFNLFLNHYLTYFCTSFRKRKHLLSCSHHFTSTNWAVGEQSFITLDVVLYHDSRIQ